tara:strand:- start:8235 stop:9923 length:1689 start_codon:yes stop_codon:yes gene_type:complete
MPVFTQRERFQRRLGALRTERSSFIDHYKLLSEFVRPRRGRFETTDRNKGERVHQSIINGRAGKALNIATAGMFNGTMSPSQPWIVLETDDKDLNNFKPVREWFFDLQQRMLAIFNATNLYNMAPIMIAEEILFGTGCMSHDDDPFDLARFYTHTVGSYLLAQDERGVVNTVVREYEATTEQIIKKFSSSPQRISEKISKAVRDQWDRGDRDNWHKLVHFVEPNPNFVPGSLKPTQKRFRSVHYEPGNNDRNTLLRTKGFDEFPFYCPRWELTGEDVYATSSPGMVALGDVRQLQLMEKRKAQAVEKMVSPPLHGPAALRNIPIGNLPGQATLYDPGGDMKGLRPVYEVRLPVGEVTQDIINTENRISEAFFTDLFKAITEMQGVQPRNRLELIQRNQERLLELGPILERQYGDFLDPLVSRTFNQMVRADLVPPPPQELENRELKPRYVSTLALAQQAATIGSIDRLLGSISGLAQVKPEVLDKLNGDAAVDEYAQLLGSPPSLINDDDQVIATREQRAQQQQMQQALASSQSVASTAKMATDAKLDNDSVGSRLVERISQ